MDNRIFNVNGKGDELLLKTLEIALMQEGYGSKTIESWKIDNEKGLVLYRFAEKDTNIFPVPLDAEQLLPIITGFLNSEKSKEITCCDWDKDIDHDGTNALGWRVYCEDWGRIGNDSYAYIAIKPAYMWYSK